MIKINKRIQAILCCLSLLVCALHIVPVHAADKADAYSAYYSLVKELYSAKDEYESFDHFKLLYIDDDAIPELLAIQYPAELVNNSTYVYRLFTYYDGGINELGEFRSGVASAGGYRGTTSYIKRSGKLYETAMSSGTGEGTDVVYKLSDGQLTVLGQGDWSLVSEESEWNGKTVSSTAYSKKIGKLFNSKKAIFFEELKTNSYRAMLKKLS